MATWRVNNSTSLGGEVCSPWQADHTYATGARCVCTVAYATTAARAFVYEATSGGGGKSHATTQPTWPTTVGNTVVDNAITWTCRSPSDGSWDNASCLLPYILNYAASAGDTIYVDDGHSESTSMGGVVTFSIKGGSVNSLIYIYCVDKADDSLSTGAVVNSPSYIMDFSGYGYSYGVKYGTSNNDIRLYSGTGISEWILEGDNTDVLNLGGINEILVAQSATYPASLQIKNGGINIGNALGALECGLGGAFTWIGGTLSRGGAKIANLFKTITSSCSVVLNCVDLSAVGTGNLIAVSSSGSNRNIRIERCKLSADTVIFGSAVGAQRHGNVYEVSHTSDESAVNDFSSASYQGVVSYNASITRSGGASDGTTSFSVKMVSSAKTIDNIDALISIPIHGWTNSTTSKTFTIEGVWDSATNIQNDEIWMELEYPANNTDGLGAIAKDKCAILGTPADQTASTETWTGTGGFSNENKFKLSVTVTPGKAGPITARVYLAKASTTVYIDPVITES